MSSLKQLVEAFMDSQEVSLDVALERIRKSSPRARLKVYLDWHGIFGYADIVFEIATGLGDEVRPNRESRHERRLRRGAEVGKVHVGPRE